MKQLELVVFGSNDAETAEAERILKRLGYEDALAFEGGYETVARGLGW